MPTRESRLQSYIESGKLVSFFLKAFLGLIGIMAASLLIYAILSGEYKGVFYILFIVICTIIVFRIYVKGATSPPKLKPTEEPELYGNLEALAAMVKRASEDKTYSRGKLEELLFQLRGKKYDLRGTGQQYLKSLEAILEGD